MRTYQGTLRRASQLTNVASGKKLKVSRLVKMHSDEMEELTEVGPGEICALFGVSDCSSGDTLIAPGSPKVSMTSMHVPAPVMSLGITPRNRDHQDRFSKAINRFTREDPTFRVHVDENSNETIISGMGELHLDIYAQRMEREFNVPVDLTPPRVAFKETVLARADFDFTHKKQSGGSGQFARVAGYIEPLPEAQADEVVFESEVVGGAIPTSLLQACEKGFKEAAQKGTLIGFPVCGVRIVLNDGTTHPVDSSDLAFRLASIYAFRNAYERATPQALEPMMKLSVEAPSEYQGTVVGGLNKLGGMIQDTETLAGGAFELTAEAPLRNLFGYVGTLRSQTKGTGAFTMEFSRNSGVMPQTQAELVTEFKDSRNQGK